MSLEKVIGWCLPSPIKFETFVQDWENVKKGNKILQDSNLNYIEANTLEDAANKAVAAIK